MKYAEKRVAPTRNIILEVLSEDVSLSLKEVVDKVKERKKVKDTSIRRQISNLVKMGLVISEDKAGRRAYIKAKELVTQEPMKELEKVEPKKLTSTETEALRSVVDGIAPLLLDAGEDIMLYDLLGRVYDLDKLIESHNLSNGYIIVARLCMDFFQRYPDIFGLETDWRSSNPLRVRVSVKDPLGLLFVRYIHDDKEINQLQYFKDKQDCYTKIVIENVKRQNGIVEEIDKALENDPDFRYITRVLALKRASPRWIFGYEFEKAINKINALLAESNLKFEVESQDRLRIVTKRFEKNRNQALVKH